MQRASTEELGLQSNGTNDAPINQPEKRLPLKVDTVYFCMTTVSTIPANFFADGKSLSF